jgi:hypothetical protein
MAGGLPNLTLAPPGRALFVNKDADSNLLSGQSAVNRHGPLKRILKKAHTAIYYAKVD